ncbi:MAG: hypothetical protein MHMPM18_001741 [Marteilia pararefringens]
MRSPDYIIASDTSFTSDSAVTSSSSPEAAARHIPGTAPYHHQPDLESFRMQTRAPTSAAAAAHSDMRRDDAAAAANSTVPDLLEQQAELEQNLLQNSQNLIKLEVALRNYTAQIESAFTFHKECLDISSKLEQQNEAIIETLGNHKLQLSRIRTSDQPSIDNPPMPRSNDNEDLKEKIELQLHTSRVIGKRLRAINTHIPQKTGAYLRMIIGPISLLLPTSADKFSYKNSYENLKLFSNIIMILLSFLLLFVKVKFLDYIFNFLLIWYYCTLTIRETILKINGSNIRRWWFMHHIFSVINSCILMCWSFESYSYQQFRFSMLLYCIYLSGMSFVQFYYQKGCLYRLYALGYSTNKMDVTVDGFVSYMWKGLGFLLPFLIVSYFFQLILCHQLFSLALQNKLTPNISGNASNHIDYPPLLIAIVLTIMSVGNFITIIIIINRKLNSSRDEISYLNITKYKVLDKLLDKSPLSKFYSSFNQLSRSNNINSIINNTNANSSPDSSDKKD